MLNSKSNTRGFSKGFIFAALLVLAGGFLMSLWAAKATSQDPDDDGAVATEDSSQVESATIVGKDWKFDGMIVGARMQNERTQFNETDTVYLNIGKEDGLMPGLHCVIYRKGDEVRDPNTGAFLGYEVLRMGVLEVTKDVSDHRASAIIRDNEDSIEIGDLVKIDGNWVKP